MKIKSVPPYLDSCFFLSVLFALLPIFTVVYVERIGVTALLSVLILFLYSVMALLFLWLSLSHKRKNFLKSEEQEQKLRASVQELKKFQLAVDNASDHIVIADADGMILYANKAVKEITGFSQSEVLGKKAGGKDLWGGNMGPGFYKKLWEVIKKKKQIFRGEVRNRKKNGEGYIAALSIAPVIDKEKRVEFLVGIERDITKEKEIDRAKTEFVSLVAHQLRSPLTAMRWYVEMLLGGDRGDITGLQKESLEEIQNGNQRMTDLVNMFLNISRIEMGTFSIYPEEVSPRSIVEVALLEMKDIYEKKALVINTEFAIGEKKYMLDAVLFRIIAQNLISNAVKYTHQEGSVTIQLYEKEGFLTLSVSDTGIGIPLKERKFIFSRMFRAKNAVSEDAQGNGLGLYIVKEIVDEARGSVAFTSEENKGTNFIVRFPVTGMQKKEGTKRLSA